MTASREKTEPRKLPMMPIRDMVIFPYMMTPFVVGRESSVRALEEALTGDRKIFLATQHDASIDEPKAKEIYQVGSICNIVQSVKMPDGNIKVLVEGVERAKSLEVNDRDGFFVATVRTGKTRLRDDAGGRAADAARDRPLRAVRQAAAVAELRDHHRHGDAWTSRPSSPTPSPPTCSSASRRSRNCWPSSIPRRAWRALPTCSTSRLRSSTSTATSSRA